MGENEGVETGFSIWGDKALLFKALAAAQGEFSEVKKTRENPFFKSKYADLADVLAACVPALNAHGLALIQPPCRPSPDGAWVMYTVLAHESGAYLELKATIPPVADWQKFGSAITYCRRYTVGALLGVAPEVDDDGNAATHDVAPEPRQERVRKTPPPLPAQAQNGGPAKAGPPPLPIPEPAPKLTDTTPMPDEDSPATDATKVEVRSRIMALGFKPPDVMRKIAAVFGTLTKIDDVAGSEQMSRVLSEALLKDIEMIPGLVTQLPEFLVKAAETGRRA